MMIPAWLGYVFTAIGFFTGLTVGFALACLLRAAKEPERLDRTPAQAWPPGHFIKEELKARGWYQVGLAEVMGIQPSTLSNLIRGKRPLTPKLARGLAEAFETSAQYWLNLESTYRLWELEQKGERDG